MSQFKPVYPLIYVLHRLIKAYVFIPFRKWDVDSELFSGLQFCPFTINEAQARMTERGKFKFR